MHESRRGFFVFRIPAGAKKNGRCGCHSFESNPEAIAGCPPVFLGPPLPHIVTALELDESLK